jgi:calcineurin-like phosphoesterase family protein
MHKILKFPYDQRNKHYWSSDWHVFHDPKTWTSPIWEMRGYNNAEEAAEQTLREINDTVGEDDTLWFLGDFFLNATDGQCNGWIDRLNCKNIYVMWGNHESNMYRIYKEQIVEQYGIVDVEIYPLKYKNLTFIGNHQEIMIGTQIIVMNHFPLRIWHKDNRGAWQLSGHSHLQDKGRKPDAQYQKGLDVGWDYKNSVWSFSEIEDVMSTKSIQILDHQRTS